MRAACFVRRAACGVLRVGGWLGMGGWVGGACLGRQGVGRWRGMVGHPTHPTRTHSSSRLPCLLALPAWPPAEDHLFGDKEKFVTAAYKAKLAERAAWQEEQKRK